MAKQEPSIDQWLAEAKQDPKAAQCGMFLTHNGVTPKKQVREGVEGLGDVAQVEFSYDAAGVDAAVSDALTWPGVYYVRVWLNEGVLNVGDSIMYVLIGADIRPNCIDALREGVSRVHILDGRIPHCLLLEIFTNRGIGTAILNGNEERYFHEQ